MLQLIAGTIENSDIIVNSGVSNNIVDISGDITTTFAGLMPLIEPSRHIIWSNYYIRKYWFCTRFNWSQD